MFYTFVKAMLRPESTEILLRIISKGGLMANAAKMYVNDAELAGQFIEECAEQCHNHLAIKLWGSDLINEIKRYKTTIHPK